MATATRPQQTFAGAAPGQETPRHILFLFDQLRALDGGAESSLLRIVRLLPPDRYMASIATFWKPRDGAFLKQFPCPVYTFPYRADLWPGGRASRAETQKADPLPEGIHRPDLLRDIGFMGWAHSQVERRSRADFQPPRHGLSAHRQASSGVPADGRLFDRIYTVSDAVRDYTIRQHWMPAEKVISIPNGVDMDRIGVPCDASRLRAAHGLEDASHLIIDVGTVKPVKGLDVLVRTAAIVCRQYPRAMFLVAGLIPPAPYFAELQALIESLGLTRNFKFLGRCDNVVPLLQMSDVFCHLSRSDGLSNALLEAMACALPCVATRVGGNPEVIEESRSGFIVPSERPELAADRVLTLLRYPECARHMGDRGKEIVEEKFTAEVMVRRLVGLYDDLLEKHRD